MEKAKLEVRNYYEVVKCECGGLFLEPLDLTIFATYPQQRDYKCNKCSKTIRLFQQDWPQIKTDVVVPELNDSTTDSPEPVEPEPELVEAEEVN